MEELSPKRKMAENVVGSVISLFVGDWATKLKSIIDDKKFAAALTNVCRSINKFIRDCDVEAMLSDEQLHKLISDVISKNGFDFKNDMEKGFRNLMKQYELSDELVDTCLMMLWQAIVQYLEKYQPDFFENERISEIHETLNNLNDEIHRLVILLEKQNRDNSKINESAKAELFKHIFGTVRKPPKTHYRVFLEKYSVYDLFVDECTQYVKVKEEKDLKNINFKEKHKDCKLSDIEDWIDSERLLCIEGNFGTGKTTLSLALQYHLEETMKKRTKFIQSTELYNKLKEDVVKENEYNLNLKEDFYLIVDSVDNIITLDDSDNNKAVIDDFADKIVALLKANPKLYLIVNSRPYYHFPNRMDKRTVSSISEIISLFALASGEFPCFTIVFPIGFKAKTGSGDNESRINNYYYQLGCRLDASSILQNSDIKKIHPEVSNSCKTPLFAYIFGSYYYNDCDGDLSVVKKEPLAIYTNFVKKTIQGKYGNDNLRRNCSFDGFFDLLRILAIEALNCSLDKIEVREDPHMITSGMDESDTFAIAFDKFNETTKDGIKEFIDHKVERASYFFINYYFFQLFPSGDSFAVKFSDNNVLYCLVANYYFNVLSFLKVPDMIPDKVFESAEKELGKFVFQYQVVDFVISSISEIEDETVKDTIAINSLQLLRYAHNHAPKKFETIKMMILLSIIFLKFYRYSYTAYKELGLKHFFKEFDWLFKAYKALDPNTRHEDDKHRFLIERYYMGAQIYDAKFKRINLKHYNFKKAVLKNVEYYQCKISDTSFESTEITDTKYTLCQFVYYIRKTETGFGQEALIQGEIKKNAAVFDGTKITGFLGFYDCTFNETLFSYMKSDEGGRIIFENCRLSSVRFISLVDLSIEFVNCIITDVDFFQCKNCSITIDDNCCINTYSSIELEAKYFIKDVHKKKIWYRECSWITTKSSMSKLLDIDNLPRKS